jgi:hypothetical protein
MRLCDMPTFFAALAPRADSAVSEVWKLLFRSSKTSVDAGGKYAKQPDAAWELQQVGCGVSAPPDAQLVRWDSSN